MWLQRSGSWLHERSGNSTVRLRGEEAESIIPSIRRGKQIAFTRVRPVCIRTLSRLEPVVSEQGCQVADGERKQRRRALCR